MHDQPQPGTDFIDPLHCVDTRSAHDVAAVFHAGAAANLDARCRDGSVDRIGPEGALVATGDLHDNPVHTAKVIRLARLGVPDDPHSAHLTLHELIHGGCLIGGMDMSYRSLCRAAALKARSPEFVHTLLANHELSQISGAGIIKDGVRVVEAFNAGVGYAFGDDAQTVHDAIVAFIRSMPLALIADAPAGAPTRTSILCAHSLPSPGHMERFDPGVLERPLRSADYEPRTGAAHAMVWGRRHTAEQLAILSERWGVGLFVLGHQHADQGWSVQPPNALVLNSDHSAGVAVRVRLDAPPASPLDALDCAFPLRG